MNRIVRTTLHIVLLAVLALAAGFALAQTPVKTVTFDNGLEDWSWGPDCVQLNATGGHPGAFVRFSSMMDCQEPNMRGWFEFSNSTDPAFVGDYTRKGPVRISVDLDVNYYDFVGDGAPRPIETSREVIIELRDYDNPYTDPETGYSWPYTSVWTSTGNLPGRNAGWAHFEADVTQVTSAELPAGWHGYGGPEDPVTYEVRLPPDRTWTDVLAGVDEIVISSLNLNKVYSFSIRHSLNVDNIAIGPIPTTCNGREATIRVDETGIVRGGPLDGQPYAGVLEGTDGDDVILGTSRADEIMGNGGNDVICGDGGADTIHGGAGDDLLFGGPGDDRLFGDDGNDTLQGGEGRDFADGGAGINTCRENESVVAGTCQR